MTSRIEILETAAGEVTVRGAIDELARLGDVLGRAHNGRLVLDLGGVTFINSLGVREWIRMQSAATERKLDLELRRVSEVLVHQLNMIVATRGTARVVSFFAPYACDVCGREESRLVDVAQVTGNAPPAMSCSECNATMVFNDFPERYFSFLAATSAT